MLIQALTGAHKRKTFDCGRAELNDWLQRIARQHQERNISKTFVAVDDATQSTIYGYYALTVAEMDSTQLPHAAQKRMPRRIPGVRLGRLAVDQNVQGKRLGELLLVDAIERTKRLQAHAGAIGLFVDAIDESAANFYVRIGFGPSPENPLMLFLPVG